MEYFTTKTIEELNELRPAIDLFYKLEEVTIPWPTIEQLTNTYLVLIGRKQPTTITLKAKTVKFSNQNITFFNGYFLDTDGFDLLFPIFQFIDGNLDFSQIERNPDIQNYLMQLPTRNNFEGRLSKLPYAKLTNEDQNKIKQLTFHTIFYDRGLELQDHYPKRI